MAKLPKIDSEGLRLAKEMGAACVSSVLGVRRLTDDERVQHDLRAFNSSGLASYSDEQLGAELKRRRLANCEAALRSANVPEEFWRE